MNHGIFPSGLFSKRNARQLSDEEILSRYKQNHDKEFIAELYERYIHLVFAVCFRYLKNTEEAKDAAMQIFSFLLDELKENEVRHFRAWLHTVTRNHCLMQLRKEKSIRKMLNSEGEKFPEESVENDGFVHLYHGQDEEEHRNMLMHALEKLNREQKMCIELKYLEEKSYEEVAVLTGFNLNQVKSHIQNGKRNLLIFMRKERQ